MVLPEHGVDDVRDPGVRRKGDDCHDAEAPEGEPRSGAGSRTQVVGDHDRHQRREQPARMGEGRQRPLDGRGHRRPLEIAQRAHNGEAEATRAGSTAFRQLQPSASEQLDVLARRHGTMPMTEREAPAG